MIVDYIHGIENVVLLILYSMCMIITHAPPISEFLNLKEPNIPKGIH